MCRPVWSDRPVQFGRIDNEQESGNARGKTTSFEETIEWSDSREQTPSRGAYTDSARRFSGRARLSCRANDYIAR